MGVGGGRSKGMGRARQSFILRAGQSFYGGGSSTPGGGAADGTGNQTPGSRSAAPSSVPVGFGMTIQALVRSRKQQARGRRSSMQGGYQGLGGDQTEFMKMVQDA